jgi:hypothetical protein
MFRVPSGLAVVGLEVEGLDLVGAAKLVDEQLAVEQERQVGRAEGDGLFDGAEDGDVLGDVARRVGDALADLAEHRAARILDDDADGRGAGIPPRRAVAPRERVERGGWRVEGGGWRVRSGAWERGRATVAFLLRWRRGAEEAEARGGTGSRGGWRVEGGG